MAEDIAVLGRGAAQTGGQHRNVIGGDLGDQLVGDAGRERLVHQRAFTLGGFVAFHALFGVIGGLAFRDADRLATDAAVTLVEQGEVIGIAVGEGDAARGIGPGAIAQRRKDKVRHHGACGHQASYGQCSQFVFHRCFLPWIVRLGCLGRVSSLRPRFSWLPLSAGRATISVFPWPRATAAPARAALRSGRPRSARPRSPTAGAPRYPWASPASPRRRS